MSFAGVVAACEFAGDIAAKKDIGAERQRERNDETLVHHTLSA
jgi:hypothetical protein